MSLSDAYAICPPEYIWEADRESRVRAAWRRMLRRPAPGHWRRATFSDHVAHILYRRVIEDLKAPSRWAGPVEPTHGNVHAHGPGDP